MRMGIVRRAKKITIICGFSISSTLLAQSPAAKEPAFWGWLAYGDLRGHLEPCGCDPKTDMGGLRRIASLLRRERGAHEGVLVFDLGNNMAAPKSKDGKKNRFMEEGILALKPDVRLFGAGEWSWLRESSDNAWTRLDEGAFVLSNVESVIEKKAGPGSALNRIRPWRQFSSAVVFGYLSPSLAIGASLKSVSPNFLAELKQQAQASDRAGLKKILLFSGSDQELAQFLAANVFDEIISGNKAPSGREPGKEERETPTLLQRHPMLPKGGKESAAVWMVPLGGQGLLRGGGLRQQRARSVEELLGGKSDRINFGTGKAAAQEPEMVTWLDPSFEMEGVVDAMFTKYNAFAKEELQRLSAGRAADLKESVFAGADACQSCHKAEYDIWKSSAHSHAFVSIKAKSKDQDPECVSCHVLGFESKGGFVSETLSSNFANVQCENCHGPAKAHVANPTKAPPLPFKGRVTEACTQCHVTPHSSSFTFASYWPKIAHGKSKK